MEFETSIEHTLLRRNKGKLKDFKRPCALNAANVDLSLRITFQDLNTLLTCSSGFDYMYVYKSCHQWFLNFNSSTCL